MHADAAPYDDCLTREGRDLTSAAAAGELSPGAFREALVDQVRAHLLRRRSVLLVGPAGSGRTSVLHALAARVANERTERDWWQSIVEWPASQFVTGTRFLGDWQTKTAALAHQAEAEGAVLALPDPWLLPEIGRSSASQHNVFAQLRPLIQQGRLLLIGEVTPEQLSTLEGTPGMRGLFERVNVPPLGPAECAAVLRGRAESAGFSLDPPTLVALTDLAARFLPRLPAPGPAKGLLERVIERRAEPAWGGPGAPVDPDFVSRVFADHSGLPDFVVSPSATLTLESVRGALGERVVGQRGALEAVVEAIALFKAGLNDPDRPIGSFLFVGPTGVGKTELARALAGFLFGSDTRLLRFDLSEFKDYHAFEQLVGSARDPGIRARLLEPVRTQPFQVVLFDELDKAHANIWDLLLPLLDEGYLTSATGERVDFRSTLVVCTSNVGPPGPERSVGFGPPADRGAAAQYELRVREALETAFRPEFLNRFQSIALFHPLSVEDVRTIARQALRAILARDGLARRRVTVEVDDAALDLAARFGFDARYGARALKRELQTHLVLPLARTLMERTVLPGNVLHLQARDGQVVVRVEDTAESRTLRREATPVPVGEGRRVTRDEATAWQARLTAAHARLALLVDLPLRRTRHAALVSAQQATTAWQDTARAARLTLERDRLGRDLARFDRLGEALQTLEASLRAATGRDALGRAGTQLLQLEARVRTLWRDLCVHGEAGHQDALVAITPLAGLHGAMAADFVYDLYLRWAQSRDATVECLCEPRSAEDPYLFGIEGHAPYGLLRGETGRHRVRRDEDIVGAVSVRVLPWLAADAEVEVPRGGDRGPLRAQGRRGGVLRSRLSLPGGLLLQNGRTLPENEQWAREVLTSVRHATAEANAGAPAPPSADEPVRRYYLEPPAWRDALLDERTARTDCLGPEAFHDLLCRRADRLSGAPDPLGESD
jgi:ATP-dependent Clp protease ATP-binding subunit ClpC